MVKLNLKQNAFHTLRQAIEHLAWAAKGDKASGGKKWDETNNCLISERGNQVTFHDVGPLARRPAEYNLKFALLHLIQSCELLLKAHLVETRGPDSILDSKAGRTITLTKALTIVGSSIKRLLTTKEFDLLLRAKDLRNQMQHSEFAYQSDHLRQICTDFLVICSFFSQRLFGVNVVAELMYDPWTDSEDPVGLYLASIAFELSPESRPTSKKIAADWSTRNPSEVARLCIFCGSRSFFPDIGFCVACGAEGDERASIAVQQLEELMGEVRKEC
jgi:hypothetical protein